MNAGVAADCGDVLLKIFQKRTVVIGVVHCPPLPGAPRYDGTPMETVYDRAVRDAEAYAAGGVDGRDASTARWAGRARDRPGGLPAFRAARRVDGKERIAVRRPAPRRGAAASVAGTELRGIRGCRRHGRRGCRCRRRGRGCRGCGPPGGPRGGDGRRAGPGGGRGGPGRCRYGVGRAGAHGPRRGTRHRIGRRYRGARRGGAGPGRRRRPRRRFPGPPWRGDGRGADGRRRRLRSSGGTGIRASRGGLLGPGGGCRGRLGVRPRVDTGLGCRRLRRGRSQSGAARRVETVRAAAVVLGAARVTDHRHGVPLWSRPKLRPDRTHRRPPDPYAGNGPAWTATASGDRRRFRRAETNGRGPRRHGPGQSRQAWMSVTRMARAPTS